MNASRMPHNRVLAATFGVLAVLTLLAQLNLQATFRQVAHPVALGTANLEADVETVRGWYEQLIEQGTYLLMVRTELVDLFWAILLGAAVVSLYRLVGGLLRNVHPRIASWLFNFAPLAAVGPAFDLVENAFSLAMLTDPFGFPEWWSTAHVIASWIKIVGSIAAAVVGPALAVFALVSARRARAGGTADRVLRSR